MSKRKTSPFVEGFFPSKQYREDDSSSSQRENSDSEGEFVETSKRDSSNSQTETSESEESNPEVCID